MRMQKCRLSMMLLLSLFVANIFGQNTPANSSNYFWYTAQMDQFYEDLSDATPAGEKVPGLMNYERNKEFWSTRVNNSPTHTGDYSKYVEQLSNYYQNNPFLPSSNSSNTWEFVGAKGVESHNQGIIVSLHIDPNNNNEVYAGTNTSGMFRTMDGGQNWSNVTDNVGLPGIGVQDIAVNPNNTAEKYIATGNGRNNYGFGVFKTTDNCNTWTQVLAVNPSDNYLVRKLLIDDENPLILYALVDRFVYRTMDGGANWDMIFDELTIPIEHYGKEKVLKDIEFKPNDHNTLYISSLGAKSDVSYSIESSAEIWKTHNAKASNVNWQRITTGLPDYIQRYALETDVSDPNTLYIAYVDAGSTSGISFFLKKASFPSYLLQNVYQRLNYSGGSYSQDLGGLGYFRFELEISPVDSDIMFVGGFNLDVIDMALSQIVESFHVSSSSHPDFHVDQRIFKTSVSNNKTYVFCGNDGGVSKYNYTDDLMQSINGIGLDNLQFFGIGDSEVLPEFYIGGTQDNGEIGNGDDDDGIPGDWIRVNVGDAYENIIDPVEPNIVYAISNGGSKSIKKSSNYGEVFYGAVTGIPSAARKKGLNDCPFVMSPQNRNTLYVAYDEIYKTTDGAGNWSQFTSFHDDGYVVGSAVQAIALTDVSPDIIYTAYSTPIWNDLTASRFFKTVDGGVNWTDLTSNLGNIIRWKPITDIKISDVNSSHVWVSFGGFAESNGTTIYKVLFSSNAGTTWTDISAGLPDIPVNCLQIVNIDNDSRIFAGNDMGVFSYDDQQNTWNSISNGLPMTHVRDIEFNYSKSELRIATFGRGIWKSKLPCGSTSSNIYISTNQTWDKDKVLSSSVIVETGNTLEINSSICMASDAKIVVEPGAKLILDGATLTSICDEKWAGIEVWGDEDETQTEALQGKIEMYNSTIEHAHEAVQLWKPQDYNKTGGMIYAENSRFLNNRRAISALSYQNIHPVFNIEQDYNANFKNCEFENNEEYLDDNPFYVFISLWGVKGVKIQGCTFKSGGYVGNGIYAINAGFSTSGICSGFIGPNGCTDWDRCEFYDFDKAISASNAGPQIIYPINIQHSYFYNNNIGAYLVGMHNVLNVSTSEFVIGNNGMSKESKLCKSFLGKGIHIEASDGFTIEYNDFSNSGAAVFGDEIIGILAKDNPSNYDVIYKNTFTGLKKGNWAAGINRLYPNNDLKGIEYRCNENSNNVRDFDVSGSDDPVDDQIYTHMGFLGISAHNSYTNTNYLGFDKHWRNMGQQTINYYYDPLEGSSYLPTAIETYNNDQTLFVIQNTVGINNCPDDGGILEERMVLTEGEQQDLETEFAQAYNDYQSVETLFNNLKDGGSTETTTLSIASAQPSDTWELRDNLLGKSPHLSKAVLIEAADRTDVLPNSVLFDILAANPDELKEKDLMMYLENKEEPLPGYMINILQEVSTGTTYKTVLLNQMSDHKYKQVKSAKRIVKSLINDEEQDLGAIKNWLANLSSLQADLQIAGIMIKENNFSDASALLNMIPDLYNVEGEALELYLDDKYMMSLNMNLKQEARNLGQLTESEISDLEVIADNESGTARASARTILEAFYGYDQYCDCLDDGDNKSANASLNNDFSKEESPLSIEASPNPASHYVEFTYQLSEIDKQGLIIITDINGKTIQTFTTKQEKGKQAWDTRSIPRGSYVFTLKTQYFEKSGKLIIQ